MFFFVVVSSEILTVTATRKNKAKVMYVCMNVSKLMYVSLSFFDSQV